MKIIISFAIVACIIAGAAVNGLSLSSEMITCIQNLVSPCQNASDQSACLTDLSNFSSYASKSCTTPQTFEEYSTCINGYKATDSNVQNYISSYSACLALAPTTTTTTTTTGTSSGTMNEELQKCLANIENPCTTATNQEECANNLTDQLACYGEQCGDSFTSEENLTSCMNDKCSTKDSSLLKFQTNYVDCIFASSSNLSIFLIGLLSIFSLIF